MPESLSFAVFLYTYATNDGLGEKVKIVYTYRCIFTGHVQPERVRIFQCRFALFEGPIIGTLRRFHLDRSFVFCVSHSEMCFSCELHLFCVSHSEMCFQVNSTCSSVFTTVKYVHQCFLCELHFFCVYHSEICASVFLK